MSVVVKRAEPVKQPPPLEIEAGTEAGTFNGNYVHFKQVGSRSGAGWPDRLALQVDTSSRDGQSGVWAHLLPQDARDLAAALVEWADAVEA